MMINNENHRLIRVSDIDIITITEAGGIYAVLNTAEPAFDILVVNCGDLKSTPMESDSLYVTECQTFNRLNIQERSLEGLCKYITGILPHLKYRPEFKFNPKETADGVLDFVWMSDRVYEENIELSKRQPNAYGWLPVDEKDVIGLKLFEKDVTLLKPTIKPLTTTHFNLTLMDTVLVVGNHGKKVKSGAIPLASCDVIIRAFGNDPDLNYFKASLYTVEDIDNGIFGFNYHLVLTGPDDFACNTLNAMLDASQHAEEDEEAIIGKFLEYATR